MSAENMENPLIPMGAITGRPSAAFLRETLQAWRDVGVTQFLIYPRSGCELEYMSEEWLDTCGEICDAAEQLGFTSLWLYDEYNWPSGTCARRILEENPSNALPMLSVFRNGEQYEFTIRRSSLMSNLFSSEVVGRFLELTHARYEKRLGKYMGRLIKGFFTDEPDISFFDSCEHREDLIRIPWYEGMEEEYRRTRAFLEEMKGSGINLIIVTKSDLVLRDLDLIASYPSPLICWSVNTLDEDFRKDMDGAVAIERRIAAMKKCHEQGLRTTCFVSPIFPGITDVFAIIDRIKGFCNYIWLENLNLRGNFKAGIMEYIKEKHPGLLPLYRDIYDRRDRTYWHMLDENVREYAQREGMLYVIDKEPFMQSADGSPVIINYFYHSEIKQSAKKK